MDDRTKAKSKLCLMNENARRQREVLKKLAGHAQDDYLMVFQELEALGCELVDNQENDPKREHSFMYQAGQRSGVVICHARTRIEEHVGPALVAVIWAESTNPLMLPKGTAAISYNGSDRGAQRRLQYGKDAPGESDAQHVIDSSGTSARRVYARLVVDAMRSVDPQGENVPDQFVGWIVAQLVKSEERRHPGP